MIDNLYNHNSSYGNWYFDAEYLEPVKTNSCDIQTNKLIERDCKGMDKKTGYNSVVEIRFLNGTNTNKTYIYACYESGIKKGDICVVKSAHHGFGIGEITSVYNGTIDEPIYREIVCIVNFDAYNTRVENRERIKQLKEQMKKRSEQLQDIALYEMLAKNDKTMMDLLDEFKTIGGM